ncbi:MAG: carbohydrate kinase family protein [Candidatus Peribacteraceae bacterium]|nr:carbohydrate kinase family protein [Candidatus Peribacteraceae bacterium]MDD5742397.1 carbohydrate kinase family protein [Candidatus Peribacteraceae bacterium]
MALPSTHRATHRPRTMSIGGATYDLFVRLNHDALCQEGDKNMFALPLGEKVHVDEVIETCGGGASNTSVGLARLGCAALFEGVIGSDLWGERLLKNLQKEGVDTQNALIVEGEVSSFSIILSAREGERVILYTPGANAHLHKSNFDRDIAEQMDWVYLNHIQESAHDIQEDIVEILAQKRPSLTWNPGGRQIAAGIETEMNSRLLPFTDLLLLNVEEALAFTHASTLEAALSCLLRSGARQICVTDGRKGVTGTDGKKLYQCPCDDTVEVVDTTGAGDAFGTGVTWALLKGLPFPTALKAGTLNAAGVVGAFGAQRGLLTETQLQERLLSTRLSVTDRPL